MKKNLTTVRVYRVNRKGKSVLFEGVTLDYGRYFITQVDFKDIQGGWKQFFKHPWQGHFYLLDLDTGKIVGKQKKLILNRKYVNATLKALAESLAGLEAIRAELHGN